MSVTAPYRLAEWLGGFAGVALLLVTFLLPSGPMQQILLSYLAAFLFFTGLSTGSLALLLVPPLTGGEWGRYLHPVLIAGVRTLPLQAVLAIPLLLGVGSLYPWAQPDHLAQDGLLRAQSWYLNPTFFVIRTICYFTLWLVLMWRAAYARRDSAPEGSSEGTAAIGLILFAVTTLFAATDWVTSLMPHWHSSIFGLMLGTGWMLSGTALAVLSGLQLPPWQRGDQRPGPDSARMLSDLGNLLLMFVLAWSYLAFMQYLTVWIADLPVETQWYLPRVRTNWQGLGWFLIAFGFIVPFAVLLSRGAKRQVGVLRAVAMLLLLAQLADALWVVLPSLRPGGFSVRWSDLTAWLGMGALWWVLYRTQLRATAIPTSTALPPAQSPRLSHALEGTHG